MSKRTRKPAPATSGGRARSAPIRIDKPKPWGTIAVAVLLAAALIGIIAYAAANTGSGVRNLLQEDDERFTAAGLVVADSPARDHVQTPVEYPDYPARPPSGGEHNPLPQQCAVYDEPVPAEHAVHSLEHGAVWVTYSPDLPADQVEELTGLVEGDPYRMLSPLPGQESPVVLTAWGRQIEVDSAGDETVEDFLSTYTNGRQTPERGAACAGNTSTGAGPVTVAPSDPDVMPEPLPEGEPVEEGTVETPSS